MKSTAATVEAYLAQLPADRRAAITAVRDVILANLDADYQEGIYCGMIGYCVPHRVFPAGYHCNPRQPLLFAGLASQKNHMALYLMCAYDCDDGSAPGGNSYAGWLKKAWLAAGKKLDMGKSCIRFKALKDVPLDVIGEAIKRVPAKQYVEFYLAARDKAKVMAAGRKAGKGARAKSEGKRGSVKQVGL